MKKMTLVAAAVMATTVSFAAETEGNIGTVRVANEFHSSVMQEVVVFPNGYVEENCQVQLKNADYPYQVISESITQSVASGPYQVLTTQIGVTSNAQAALTKQVAVNCRKTDGSVLSQSVRVPAPPSIDISGLYVEDYMLKGSIYIEGNASNTECRDFSSDMPWSVGNLLADEFSELGKFNSAYVQVSGQLADTFTGVNQIKFECLGQGGITVQILEVFPTTERSSVSYTTEYWK